MRTRQITVRFADNLPGNQKTIEIPSDANVAMYVKKDDRFCFGKRPYKCITIESLYMEDRNDIVRAAKELAMAIAAKGINYSNPIVAFEFNGDSYVYDAETALRENKQQEAVKTVVADTDEDSTTPCVREKSSSPRRIYPEDCPPDSEAPKRTFSETLDDAWTWMYPYFAVQDKLTHDTILWLKERFIDHMSTHLPKLDLRYKGSTQTDTVEVNTTDSELSDKQ